MSIDIDHKLGTVYLSGGMEHANADDPLGGKWRRMVSSRLESLGFVPLDITEIGLQYNARHGDVYSDLTMDTTRDQMNRKAIIRTHFVDADLKLLSEDTDAIILYWDEAARRGAGTVSEAQFAYNNDIPIFIVSAWENWETEVPGWLFALSTKVFTNFDDCIEYMGFLPRGILSRDEYDNRGTDSHYLCSLTGEVFEKQSHHFISKVSPLYSKEAVTTVRKSHEDHKVRYEFMREYLVKQYGNNDAAYERLAKSINTDVDYAHSWLCNLSVCLQDNGNVDKAAADKAASNFLKIAFGSELTMEKYDQICKNGKKTNNRSPSFSNKYKLY